METSFTSALMYNHPLIKMHPHWLGSFEAKHEVPVIKPELYRGAGF